MLGDDHVLRDVDQPARQVAGVGGLQRGVRQPLARAVRRDEVLLHGEAFTEVGGDRRLDDLARRLGHQPAHAGQLPDLLLAAPRPGVGHDVDRVELPAVPVDGFHLAEHRVGDVLGGLRPDRDHLVVALAVGDGAFEVLRLDLDHLVARAAHQPGLLLRNDQVVDADRQPGSRGVGEAEVLQRVEHLDRLLEPELEVAALHQLLQPLLLQQAVDERHLRRGRFVEDHPPDRGVDDLVLDDLDLGAQHVLIVAGGGQILQVAAVAQPDRRQRLQFPRFQRQHHVFGVAEGAPFTLRPALGLGEVVDAEHDVLRRDGDRRAVRRRQDVVARQHQHRGFDLRLGRQRDVDRHLVAVEVGVERRADQRMDADRLALDQHRLERLDPEPMQGRRAVEQHRMLADDLLEDVPHFRPLQLDHLLRLLDGGDQAALFELVVDERLEQLERHLLGQPALVQLQLRADDDHRPARVVDALAEQVLTEPALLALERIGQRLERTVVGAAQDAAAAAVVEQRVDRLLQHALLVADDDVRRLELHQLLQPVVAVDDAAIEVVQVGGREAAAVERHQRTQLGRNDRDDVEDHPLRPVARLAERIDDLQPLGELQLLLRRLLGAHLLAQLDGELLDVHALEQLLDRLGAHLGAEPVLVLVARLPVLLFVQQLVLLELGLLRVDDDVGFEVEDALEIAQGDVEQVPDPARQPLEEPDMAHRRRQRDVAEPLAPDLRLGDLDAALVADDAAVLHPLVLAAQALPVGDRAEDLGAEQAVALGLERPVVDGFRLGHLAVRPGQDLLRRREADPDGVEIARQRRAFVKAGSHSFLRQWRRPRDGPQLQQVS